MKQIAAFFDIDGTIYREGLITEVFKKLVSYELIDGSKWYNDVRPAFLSWDKRIGDYDTYLLKMVDIYVEAAQDIHEDQIAYIAKKVIEQKGDRVYTFSRERIKWHQENQHKVIAISGSPIELVKEMSEKYGMDDYKGTIYEKTKDGKYNGKVVPMWDAASKKKAILEMVERYGIDLGASYAYGDTAGDFIMLKMVGHPFAINPTKELLTKIKEDEALKQKITIIVERKDVTYRLNIESLDLL
ncbi:HAD-IB family hydrolase [Sporanaerobium hydrogeniformans]|uniref:HAD-IB family hydrolase n=1 Tax=Sporanaerobium hydrogeniformans TaxID=3072179 RepID=A0AC61DCF9_9FIRM|nr:HAD-IB family hydrolase [Sporanaerobium hydrogeniformans]PHV71009.1 HAD-IB family hydrolase [Sporanaerobium hydrogeniformans]